MAAAKKTTAKKPKAPSELATTEQSQPTAESPSKVAGKPVVPKSQLAAIHTLEKVAESRPDLRRGKMFGCEAIFVGRRAVLCVFGKELNLTLPDLQVERLLSNPAYRRFAPSGRVMRGWVLMPVSEAEKLSANGSLLDDAITHARSKDLAAARC